MFDSHGLHLTALTRCQLHLPTALLWAGAGAPSHQQRLSWRQAKRVQCSDRQTHASRGCQAPAGARASSCSAWMRAPAAWPPPPGASTEATQRRSRERPPGASSGAPRCASARASATAFFFRSAPSSACALPAAAYA